MAKIIKALRSLNVEVKLIVDIDVLNDETVFKGIIEAYDIDYNSIKPDYNNIVSNLHSTKEKINRVLTKTSINQILDNSNATDLSQRELKLIRGAISTISKWDGVKSSGVAAIPAGNATTSYRTIDQLLKEHGVFIVPVGELECFIKEVGGHGPEWTNVVLETYPNLDDDVYQNITSFIQSINI